MKAIRPAKPVKKRLGLGLGRKWLRNCFLVVIVTVIIAVLLFSMSFTNYYYTSVRTILEEKAESTSAFFSSYVIESYNEYYKNAYQYAETFEDRDTLEMQFINTSGRIIVSSYGLAAGYSPGTDDITGALTGKVSTVFQGKDPETGEHIMAVSSPLFYSGDQVVGVMRYVTSLRLVDEQISRVFLTASLVGLAVLLIVAVISMYFIRSIVRPLGEITYAAQQIAEGGYGFQIENEFSDEIGVLRNTINDMSQKIKQSEKTQNDFVSSVSHELRTPITAISGWSETLLDDPNMDPGDLRKGLGIIVKESKRLGGMVEELLEFSRIQDGRFTIRVEEMDLRAELEDVIYMYRSQFSREDMDFEYFDCNENLIINGDPERIKQVFFNIFDNAVKHGRAGKKITTRIALGQEEVIVTVRDHGPGVPEDELPQIKMKFYKGSSKERGSGIGLAVCDEIVRLHGGHLEFENAEGGGLRAIISLPMETATVSES
ncbi:MAG: HAMP domain-containing histidine kinase [Oscillospiraceae bacterium]|nr:HAMP domain-containing histidine kinase [Oscillospiraceae bacterium]